MQDIGVCALAKRLGVYHVPAVVGFEAKGQRQVPIVGGVLVLPRSVELLQDASGMMMELKDCKAEKKRLSVVLGRWERLVNGAVTRRRLKDTYGH